MTLTNVKTLMLIGILEVKVKDYEAVKKRLGEGMGEEEEELQILTFRILFYFHFI